MPGRNIPLITNQIYHVINRGVASQPTFTNKDDYLRALEIIFYYQSKNVPSRYSFFLRQSVNQRDQLLNRLKSEKDFLVEIIAYCLMPNHFHFLLKQTQEGGISTFTANVTNSYTRYFNTKNQRVGHLFQGKFKAIRIETDEQLVHLSRYIHLNPYTSCLVKNFSQLYNYPYSSLPEYLNPKSQANCQKDIVLENFKNPSSPYKKFISDQADYQKRLQKIKYLTLEKEYYPRCAI